MKLIIAGSRSIDDIKYIYKAYRASKYGLIKEVVSGHARGVDKLGERFAIENGIPIKLFKADWEKEGRSAGHRRNQRMGDYADALLAVWDGRSRGTKSMVSYMKKIGKPYYVYEVHEDYCNDGTKIERGIDTC